MTSQSYSGTGSASESGSISSSQNENLSPLWDYVTKIEKQRTIGGTWNFRCNICGETRSGSYTKIKAHLLQNSGEGIAICKKVTKNQKLEMVRLVEEWEKKKKGVTREVSLPCQSQDGVEIESSSKKRKSSLSPLARSFDMNTRAQLDEEIARMFYTVVCLLILLEILIITGLSLLLQLIIYLVMFPLVIINCNHITSTRKK
ncbi:hypothetical protein HRI_002415200 [Hibiscus trionum]|uniref:BED-type domain-containing protein n=1 Tax=Hibiscus trionum TaxID=183268 RepID=A0A9W7I188_HIBTR|nr:hypothetical protein HRI_002415200 [Hibiscus trionum]